jgi:Ca2+-binding RTX toxin-like protein
VADTPVELDERIQNLNFRADTVLSNLDLAPEILVSSLKSPLAANAFGATLGTDDLSGLDDRSAPLTYTLTSLPTGTLLVRGEIAVVGTRFTQVEIDAGKVQLLAGAVSPDALGVLADRFGFAVSDGAKTAAGSFGATYAAYETVQTAPRFGGYWGGASDDYQRGTDGADLMSGSGGADMLLGGAGNDTLNGGNGPGRLFGGTGDDILNGGNADDLLDGGEGRDILDGKEGDNILLGGAGDDVISGGNGDDRIFGGEGRDYINARNGANRIDGGAGNDVIIAGNGNDVIIAGAGDDEVFAGNGRNLFKLGGIQGALTDGNDSFTGGNGADSFALFVLDRDAATGRLGQRRDQRLQDLAGRPADRLLRHRLVGRPGPAAGGRAVETSSPACAPPAAPTCASPSGAGQPRSPRSPCGSFSWRTPASCPPRSARSSRARTSATWSWPACWRM